MVYADLKMMKNFPESDDPDSPFGISCRSGIGNWEAFIKSGFTISDIFDAAADWKNQIGSVERPWLCWNVNSDWCFVQQKLVESVGWTPIVGADPRCTDRPRLSKNAIFVDFNRKFRFKILFPHFIMDFVFKFLPKMAFWHSDLLLSRKDMAKYAELFDRMPPGSLAATEPNIGLRTIFGSRRDRRFWELLGCTTSGASEENYRLGCGWWLAFYLHPNCPSIQERRKRIKYHWECGVGIKYWSENCGGKVITIPEDDISSGHFTRINNKKYVLKSPYGWNRNIQKDLPANFSLKDCCEKMQIDDLLE